MAEVVFLVLCVAGAFVLAMHRAPMWAWAAALAGATLVWRTGLSARQLEEPAFTLLGLSGLGAGRRSRPGLSIPPLRRAALIEPAFRKIKGILPKVSATEQEALNAGTIGFDAELFSGTARLGEAARRAARSR